MLGLASPLFFALHNHLAHSLIPHAYTLSGHFARSSTHPFKIHTLKVTFYSYRCAPSFFDIFLPSLLYVEVLMNGDRFKALRAVRLWLST